MSTRPRNLLPQLRDLFPRLRSLSTHDPFYSNFPTSLRQAPAHIRMLFSTGSNLFPYGSSLFPFGGRAFPYESVASPHGSQPVTPLYILSLHLGQLSRTSEQPFPTREPAVPACGQTGRTPELPFPASEPAVPTCDHISRKLSSLSWPGTYRFRLKPPDPAHSRHPENSLVTATAPTHPWQKCEELLKLYALVLHSTVRDTDTSKLATPGHDILPEYSNDQT